MTAASRRRKQEKHHIVDPKVFIFPTTKKNVKIIAVTLKGAQTLFQERYGYWPDKEINHGTDQRTGESSAIPPEAAPA